MVYDQTNQKKNASESRKPKTNHEQLYSQKQPMTTNQSQPRTNDPTKHCWNNQVCILNNSLCSCTHLSNFQRHRSTAEAIFTLFNCEPPPSVARAFHLALILSRWGSMHLKMMHLSNVVWCCCFVDIIHNNTRLFPELSACLFVLETKRTLDRQK